MSEAELLISDKDDHLSVPLSGCPDFRWHECYSLKLKGWKLARIARKFDVCEKTVSRWIISFLDWYRSELEQSSAVSVISEKLAEIEEIKSLALKDYEHASTTESKMKCLNTVLRATSMGTDLMLQTGIIPKVAEQIYATVESKKPADMREELIDRPVEEVKHNILRLMRTRRTII